MEKLIFRITRLILAFMITDILITKLNTLNQPRLQPLYLIMFLIIDIAIVMTPLKKRKSAKTV